jgi:hypothetical protein
MGIRREPAERCIAGEPGLIWQVRAVTFLTRAPSVSSRAACLRVPLAREGARQVEECHQPDRIVSVAKAAGFTPTAAPPPAWSSPPFEPGAQQLRYWP